jgi:hypothetical protein
MAGPLAEKRERRTAPEAGNVREAEARGDASVAVGGQLVDRPIVLRARRMLEIIAE